MALTAKITQRSKKIAQEIMVATGKSRIEIIEHALRIYYRQWRLAELAKQFENLSGQKAAAYRDETELLDHMSGDGLEDEISDLLELDSTYL